MIGVLSLFAATAQAHPNAGQTSVVVVMKMARCSVCIEQLRTLRTAEIGAPIAGITHEPPQAAAVVTRATGVPTYSHGRGIVALGLWRPDLGIAQPAVVVYDKCGDEAGRIVGRRPGLDVTDQVRALVEVADQVQHCGAVRAVSDSSPSTSTTPRPPAMLGSSPS